MPYARPSGLDKTMPDALELGSPTDDRSWKYSEAGVETMPGVLAIACNVVDPFPDCIRYLAKVRWYGEALGLRQD